MSLKHRHRRLNELNMVTGRYFSHRGQKDFSAAFGEEYWQQGNEKLRKKLGLGHTEATAQ